jgi:hypothetical protein
LFSTSTIYSPNFTDFRATFEFGEGIILNTPFFKFSGVFQSLESCRLAENLPAKRGGDTLKRGLHTF